jgi:hypothetical protein
MYRNIARDVLGEISSSHGGEYEDDCLLECYTVKFGRYRPALQRRQ